jgi:protein-disulfide isomerase
MKENNVTGELQAVQPINPAASAKRDIGLILAIIFASSAISGSLVFFGMQMKGGNNTDLQVSVIEQAFDNYVKKQQNKQLEDQQKAQEEQDKADQDKAMNVKAVTAEDHLYGNKDAKVTLIEYSDYECPYCKVFDGIAKQLVSDYDGDLNWVYRHYPLSFHDPMATKEAEAGECIAELGGNDAFWDFTDEVYSRTKSGGNGLSLNDVYQIASDIGVNANSVKTCVESGKYADKIAQEMADGLTAGVAGTPGNILINNETGEVKAVHGARNISVFKGAIDELLN